MKYETLTDKFIFTYIKKKETKNLSVIEMVDFINQIQISH